MISNTDLDKIFFACSSLYNIDNVYFELVRLHPEFSSEQLKDAFLYAIAELMRRGRVQFVGELHLLDSTAPDAKPMFGEAMYTDWDFASKGARPADDSSPEGVAALIRSKWPPELVPELDTQHPGFDPLWFYKWEFRWYDEQGRQVES